MRARDWTNSQPLHIDTYIDRYFLMKYYKKTCIVLEIHFFIHRDSFLCSGIEPLLARHGACERCRTAAIFDSPHIGSESGEGMLDAER